jgi:hypothetical protein
MISGYSHLLIFFVIFSLIVFMDSKKEKFCDYYCQRSCMDMAEVMKRNPRYYGIAKRAVV